MIAGIWVFAPVGCPCRLFLTDRCLPLSGDLSVRSPFDQVVAEAQIFFGAFMFKHLRPTPCAVSFILRLQDIVKEARSECKRKAVETRAMHVVSGFNISCNIQFRCLHRWTCGRAERCRPGLENLIRQFLQPDHHPQSWPSANGCCCQNERSYNTFDCQV